MRLYHSTPKFLANAVRRNQPKTAKRAGAGELGSAVPPERHIIGGLGNLRISGSKSLGIAIPKKSSHRPVPDKRWVAHNEVCFRPSGLPGIRKAKDKGPCRLVRHILPCQMMLLQCLPVPARHGLALSIQNRLFAVEVQNGVPAFDVMEGLDDRLSGHSRSEGAEVPLEVADPQHKLGDGGGAGVDLDAEELVRVNGVAGSFENRLGFA